MSRHAVRSALVALLLLIAGEFVAGCNPWTKRSNDGSDRDEYVPPEPDRERHDAPPRRPNY